MKTDEDVRRVEETKTDLESTIQKSKFMIKSMSKTKKNERMKLIFWTKA